VRSRLTVTPAVKNRMSKIFTSPVYRMKNKILGAFAKLLEVTIRFVRSLRLSFCLPVHMEKLTPPGWIFIKFHIWIYFENLSRKFKFNYNLARIAGTLHKDLCTFLILSCWILLRMRNVSYKILCSRTCFRK